MNLIRRSLFALLTILFINGTDSMDDGSNGSLLNQFHELYDGLFGSNMIQNVLPQQVKLRLDLANQLANRLANSIVPTSTQLTNRVIRVRSLVWISEPNLCNHQMLYGRYELQNLYDENIPINGYLRYYNRREFERCAREYGQHLSNIYQQHLSQTPLGSTVRFMRNYQNAANAALDFIENNDDGDNAQIFANNYETIDDINLVFLSQAVIDYLASQGHDVWKSYDESMATKNAQMTQLIVNTYQDYCANLIDEFGTEYVLYEVFMEFDQELRRSGLMGRHAYRFMDQINICEQIERFSQHIYPLGEFEDFDTLIGHIRSTNVDENAEEDASIPIVIRSLLDTASFVGQAELIISEQSQERNQMLRQVIDYLTISQINRQKCQHENYLRMIKTMRDNHEALPDLHRYLSHFVRLQLIDCIESFSEHLRQLVAGFGEQNLARIRELHQVFDYIRNELRPNVKLYKNPIPYELIALACQRYMAMNGFHMINMLNPQAQQANRPQSERHFQRLFDSCRSLTQRTNPIEAQFNLLLSIAQENDNFDQYLEPTIQSWMEQHNICREILSLPPRVAVISNAESDSSSSSDSDSDSNPNSNSNSNQMDRSE